MLAISLLVWDVRYRDILERVHFSFLKYYYYYLSILLDTLVRLVLIEVIFLNPQMYFGSVTGFPGFPQ